MGPERLRAEQLREARLQAWLRQKLLQEPGLLLEVALVLGLPPGPWRDRLEWVLVH